ncbi:hypothetical protein NECAME_06962 [Necator americanus]|uniref:Uncharacterized protein n=1 Tax=Necator americanus TaxID=51031 RepID=W2TR08_NECAM|nr:hypothetical protein NECAME_06962 [Necator americanus]ETN84218.1 hypothetical protein NECAME_06962 [Necator americanus]
MKLFDRGALSVDADKDSLKRPLPAAFTQFDPASKRPLPIIPQQMQNNMLTHQQLMQQAAIQAAMQARTMPSTAQNSYLSAPPHLRTLDGTTQQQLRTLDAAQQLRPLDTTAAAQQMRQMENQAAAAAAAQQYRAHDPAVAQQLQRQLPPHMLQNQVQPLRSMLFFWMSEDVMETFQAALQMRNQQMTVQEYHNLLRLAQPTAIPQRRQTIPGSAISPQFQMTSSVPRLQRPAATMAPSLPSPLQFSHQMAQPLSSLAPPMSLAAPIPLAQSNLLAQQLMSNAMRATAPTMVPPNISVTAVSQPQNASAAMNAQAPPTSTNLSSSTGGMDDAEFLAFLENVRQIEAHLTRTLAESIQRSTSTAQQQTQ